MKNEGRSLQSAYNNRGNLPPTCGSDKLRLYKGYIDRRQTWKSIVLFYQFIEWSRVRIIEVPHIEELRIPEVLEFASLHCSIQKYMPNYESEKYPSRKWICNVGGLLVLTKSIVNSLIHDQFKGFVNEKITENNDQIDRKEGNKFSVLPSMTKFFNETNFVSSILLF